MEKIFHASLLIVIVYLQHGFKVTGQNIDRQKDIRDSKLYSHDRVKRGIVNSSRFSDPCKNGFNCEINQVKKIPHCYCDDQCIEFNDCCYNYVPNSKAGSHPVKEYKNYLRCSLNVISEHRSLNMGVYLVSKCPADFLNGTISSACLYEPETPVTDEYNITFANKFCAFCHGVTSFKFWTVNVQSNREMCNDGLMDLLDNNQSYFSDVVIERLYSLKCNVVFEPPEGSQFRVCYITKQGSPSVFKNLCDGYLNPIQIWDYSFTLKVYKNFHCIDKKQTRSYSCLSDVMYDFERGLTDYDLTVIFNINIKKRRTIKFSRPVETQHNDQCFKVGCSSNIKDCLKYSTHVKNYPIKLSTVFMSNSSIAIDNKMAQRLVSFYESCLPVSVNEISIKYWKVKIGYSNTTTLVNSNKVENAVNIQMSGRVSKFSTMEDVKKLEKMLSRIKLNYSEEILVENGSSSTIQFWTENRQIKEIGDTYIWKRDVAYTTDTSSYYLSLLNNAVPLNISECVPVFCSIHTTVFYDQSPNPGPLNFLLNEYDCSFELTEEVKRAVVMTDDDCVFQNNTLDRVFIRSVMTYVCLSISSFAAFNTFCIFLKLELFTSVAGAISQNVLIVIFLFNIFFLLGLSLNDFPILCFLIGISTHYLALSYFLWVTMFVVHTVFTIKTAKTFKKANPSDQTRRLKMILSLLGYSSPAVVVIPSVVIDSCNCTEYKIEYGGEICFPTAFPSNLVVFIVPTGLCIVINVFCLLYSAIVLTKLNSTMTHEGLQKSRSYVVVFLRMCCVSAISWLLGVIAGIFDEVIIGFCFIILSGLHGFIICVCLLSTNVFRDALQAYRNKNTSSGTEIEMIVADEDNLQTKTQEGNDGVISELN